MLHLSEKLYRHIQLCILVFAIIKSSLYAPAYKASLHFTVTYVIYSQTYIIVLGQLLIRLLIPIKQSLSK